MTNFRQKGLVCALLATAAMTFAGCSTTQHTVDQMDDSAITTAVKTRMAADPDVKAHEIDVDTVDGKVTLTGKVESEAIRAEAVQLARNTDGVRSVSNNLTVGAGPSLGEMIDDKAITANVKSKLADDPVVKARDIDVDTIEGVVTLTGKVQTWSERSLAQQIAQETHGVRAVKNRLEVATGG
jgi:hyperosmotically inducible protein